MKSVALLATVADNPANVGLTAPAGAAHADTTRLKPFILVSNGPGDAQLVARQVQQALVSHSFNVVGRYAS